MTDHEHIEPAALTTKRKRMMIYFIEATRKLIQSDGIDGLSIRKIATEAGYNSATIYNYFHDLEHLTLFGSVCYLREYVLALSGALTPNMTSLERFRTIYRCFNDIAFQNPDIFHNMFFGRHSHRLGEVLHTYYYELFPEELAEISPSMRQMMVSGSMRERDSITMQEMVRDGFVSAEKADMMQDILIALHQNYIYQASILGEQLDLEAHKEHFNQMFEYLLETAK